MSSTGNQKLDAILDNYARRRVGNLRAQDVMAELRQAGINTLEDLVEQSVRDFDKGGTVAATTFIYEQFVYKEGRVIPDEFIDAIESKIVDIRR